MASESEAKSITTLGPSEGSLRSTARRRTALNRVEGSSVPAGLIDCPLARRLADHRCGNAGLVSAWCTKQHGGESFVRIESARAAARPSAGVLVARTSPPAAGYKTQIRAAVAAAAELPPGPVRLELSFVVGPARNWLNLWKPTIDALDPLLGRTQPDRSARTSS